MYFEHRLFCTKCGVRNIVVDAMVSYESTYTCRVCMPMARLLDPVAVDFNPLTFETAGNDRVPDPEWSIVHLQVR